MLRRQIMALTAMCVGVLVALTLITRNAGGDSPTKPTWEYGQLKFFTTPIPGKPKVALWVADNQRIEVETGAELYKQLGGKDQKQGWDIEIWNLLGSQGWEFVSEVYNLNDPTKYGHVVFKRLK